MTKWLSFLLLIPPVAVFSQGADVRGVVADSLTGERIPYATVSVRGAGRGASTNASGFYLIPNVTRGKQEIVARVVGYVPENREVLVGGEFVALNFTLKPRPVESSEVAVEGRRAAGAAELGTSVDVLDRKEILQVPAAAAPDLFRTLQLLPGSPQHRM